MADERRADTAQEENLKPGEHEERVTQENIEKVMEKYDRESLVRKHTGAMGLVIAGLCVLFALVQVYAALTANIPATQLRPLHLGFVMMLVLLIYPIRRNARRDHLPIYDIVLAVLAMACCLYIVFQHIAIAGRISSRATPPLLRMMDMVVGGMIILLLFECCRRIVGLPIMVISAVFILYALFGRYMPGFLAHRGYGVERLITYLVYTTEGIMGVPLGASSTFIFLFVLFGAFLERTQVGEFFIDLSNAVAGHKRGGPAKVAVITSALEGTVSGSSVANTVGSGSFTIPMMKKLGYRPEFAAAVEAAASTGGQIMPPVMGAAAFLMAESVGVSYMEVAKAAIIPALLYFAGIYIIVDLEAKKSGLRGLDRAQLPKLGLLMKTKGYLILPLIVIISFLGLGYTPIFAALVGILSAAFCDLIRHTVEAFVRHKAGAKGSLPLAVVKQTGGDILASLHGGARGVLGVAVACGMAGIIVGMITLTGLGLELGNGLTNLAGGAQIPTLMLTMFASLLLGMGVPTTANYLITSTIMAGTVMKVMGCEMLTAHMFVFYFGIMADITPPVALASMAGSAIAGSKPMQTGLNSVKLAIAAFLVPYLFAYNEKMLFIGAQWYDILQICITALIGMVGIGAAVEGYFSRHAHLLQRAIFLAGGLLLIEPTLTTDLIGLALIVVAFGWQELENRKFGGRMQPSHDLYAGMRFWKKLAVIGTESFTAIRKLFA